MPRAGSTGTERSSDNGRSRRRFLQAGASLAAAFTALRAQVVRAQLPNAPGAPVSGYGVRSRFEKAVRFFGSPRTPQATVSFTPLADSYGTLTPPALHFERHHAGVPEIDPAAHTLTVHGLVERPLTFSLDELKRFPSVSRSFFIECSGNTSSEWRGANAPDVQRTHGMTSCSEWTGVWLSTLLRECGVRPNASWLLAEGADAARVARSIPIAKAMDNVLVAYAQNGEPLRPEQGYPLRLVVPGWEGIINIKWVHRLELIDRPAMTRWETSKYTDLLPDGKARIFSFEMDAKSVITRPSGGDRLPGAGVYEVSGIAWSGRGAIVKVEITTDGGLTWTGADLQTPVQPLAHTRFRWSWRWNGADAMIASRATDSSGYVQPTLPDLIRARGLNSGYHNNAIQPWKIAASGAVTNGL
jgi:sulfane dehydrogenase subunit SoxC